MLRSNRILCTRRYSISQFVPENEKFIFDNEKLTVDQIREKIPKRPVVDETNVRKHFYDIPSTNSLADLIIQPEFYDIFITSLARNKPFSGSDSLKMVVKPQSPDAVPQSLSINLQFESKAHQWINEFKDKNFELADLPEASTSSLLTLSKRVEDQISSQLDAVLHGEGTTTPGDDFQSIFTALNVFRNHERKLAGELHQSELHNMITFDHLLLYLLTLATTQKTSTSYFVELLTFIERNLTLCSYDNGILPILEILIPYLRQPLVIKDSLKRDTFDRFYDQVLTIFTKVQKDLSLNNLDKLAYISYESSNPTRGSKIIKNFIRQSKVAPSRETFQSLLHSFIIEAEAENTTDPRSFILLNLRAYKPLIHHFGIDEVSFELIRQTISTTFELDHLVKFIEQQPNKTQLFTNSQIDLFQILHNIQQASSNSLDLIKRLEVAQLQRRLVIDNGIQLNERTIEFINSI